MSYKITYLKNGKLWYKHRDSNPVEIQSTFATEIRNRMIRLQQKNNWKTEVNDTPFKGSMLWGVKQINIDRTPLNITSVIFNQYGDSLYYILESNTIGGLLYYDIASQTEKRLFHKENFNAYDIAYNPYRNILVGVRRYGNGSSNIMRFDLSGAYRDITDGDSVDEAPCWRKTNWSEMLYQSAGIATDKNGYTAGLGHCSILSLDLNTSEQRVILENDKYDYLQPKTDAADNIYFIKRPYEYKRGNEGSLGKMLFDFVMFPFRIISSILFFLNDFSLFFSKKPIISAGGPKTEEQDQRFHLIRGRMIDVKKLSGKKSFNEDTAALVPKNWQLIRQTPAGEETVIANSAVSYDICDDGTIIYTNGLAAFMIKDNKETLLFRDKFIEHISASV